MKIVRIILLSASILVVVPSYKLRDTIEHVIEQSGDFGDFSNPVLHSDQTHMDDQIIMKSFSKLQKQGETPKPAEQPNLNKPRRNQTNLNEDVNDFIELVPKSEIKAKIKEYYLNDMDTQYIFEFMHKNEFQELRRYALDIPDVKDFLQYLNINGININGIVRKVDNRLGISKIRRTILSNSYTTSKLLGE